MNYQNMSNVTHFLYKLSNKNLILSTLKVPQQNFLKESCWSKVGVGIDEIWTSHLLITVEAD